MQKTLLKLMVAGATLGMLGGVAVVLLISYYSQRLPDHEQLKQYDPATVTRLYTADGEMLAEYAREKRVFVPITAIPKRLINAFIAAEDRNFYTHPGVDFIGVFRAALTNIMNIGQHKTLVGGSTITQQVVKNFLLTNEKSLERKIKEAILAIRISESLSKDRIMELYLNEIYLGAGSYGVASAALNYFNKSIDELNIEEAALLASMPKAPSAYNPRKNYDRAKERRDWVIGRMREDGFITAADAESARATPIVVHEADETKQVDARYFSEEIRRQVAEMYGDDMLYEGGLSVRTTLDPRLQKLAEQALMNGLVEYDTRHGWRGAYAEFESLQNWREQLKALAIPQLMNGWQVAVVTGVDSNSAAVGLRSGETGIIPLEVLKWARAWIKGQKLGGEVRMVSDVLSTGDVIFVEPRKGMPGQYELRQIPDINGAIVSLDPHTGRVLAMVGGSYFTRTQFNRATQAKRQPGSAFKPFIYLAGLENGFTPASIIMDSPISIYQGPGLPLWEPKNYSHQFYGPTTFRTALEHSRNVPTVRLAQMIGLKEVQRVGVRSGIYESLPAQYSSVLGAIETTVMDITSAYAGFVNGGKKVSPQLIERIQDKHGRTIYRRDQRECPKCLVSGVDGLLAPVVPDLGDDREEIIDPVTAYQMTSILNGVVERGTGVRAKSLGRPLGGKTGTTNSSMDTWFIGFSPDLVTGVFIGFDQPKPLGNKETGASTALPVWIDYMGQALKDTPPIPFRIPDGVKLVKIDRTTGLLPNLYTDKKNIMWEAFRAGTEPTAYSYDAAPAPFYPSGYAPPVSTLGYPDRNQSGAVISVSPARDEPESPSSTVGTGGLY